MRNVLFLVTELQKPVGGLHRYATELLPAWRSLLNRRETTFEPIVLSIYQGGTELKESIEIPGVDGVRVFEGIRGGEKCYFLQSRMPQESMNDFHKELWDKYRVKSERAAQWDFYKDLNAFWRAVPLVAAFIEKELGKDIALIDAQDWLAFPGGFLAKERINKPLLCRFHSGEFGRSVGKPDFDGAPLRIETAALAQADFVQAVSLDEAKFELYNLLPLKQDLCKELKAQKGESWFSFQARKDRYFEEFLILEPEDLEIISKRCAGFPNGINLDPWRQVTASQIDLGFDVYKKIFPNKNQFILFVGRTDYRKGIDALLEAFARIDRTKTGLLVSSAMSHDEYEKYKKKTFDLGIDKDCVLYNAWLEEDTKKSLFCASTVIALPSLYEPFGLVTLEALAANLSCLANGFQGPVVVVGDTGGMREVIRNGVDGFKAPMEEDRFDLQPEYLARILEMALSRDRRQLTQKAAERVQSSFFNWNSVAQRNFECYEKAIENFDEEKRASI
jgi:glycosyltransferase involved in cell wall biosynthesis